MTHLSSETPISLLRQNLLAVLSTTGPGLPTLCEGWQTEHLVAHLLLRETRPDLAAGIVLPPLARRLERRTAELAAELSEGREYVRALERFAQVRPLSRRLGRVDEAMNVLEYVVHREDVVRGSTQAAEMCSGLLSSSAQEPQLVWEKLVKAGPLLGRRHTGGLVLEGTDEDGTTLFGPRRVRRPARATSAGQTTLVGTPVDLALHLYGREEASRLHRAEPAQD